MSKNKSAIKNIKLMLGTELRRVRDEKGWTLEEAAAAAGIERSDVIRHFEAGNFLFSNCWRFMIRNCK